MSIKKIFMILITIVACVMIGAFALNTLLPNVTSTLVNSTEDMVFKATGMGFDFNNDGNTGDSSGTNYQGTEGDSNGVGKGTVDGFK